MRRGWGASPSTGGCWAKIEGRGVKRRRRRGGREFMFVTLCGGLILFEDINGLL